MRSATWARLTIDATRGVFFAKIGVFYTTGAVLSMRKLG